MDSTSIQLQKPIVKLVIKDLIKGDSFKEELSIISTKIFLLENKIILKDSVIYNLNYKINNFNSILLINNSQLQLSEDLNKKLNSSLKKQKFKTKLIGGMGIASVVGIILLLK
jgi:ankyrin repeat protein